VPLIDGKEFEDKNDELYCPLIMNQLSISKNGESGVLLYDYFPEGVLLHDSKIWENRLDGMAFIQRSDHLVINPHVISNSCVEILSSCTSFLNKKEQINSYVIKVSNSEIHNNGMSGL